MFKFRVDKINFEQFVNQAALFLAAQVFVGDIKRAKEMPVNIGNLRGSISFGVEMSKTKYIINVFAVPYGKYMEEGTRPHFPPIQALQWWAKRKFQLKDKEALAVAWAVAKAIAKRGLAPRHFIQNTIDRWLAEGKLERYLVR